MPDELDSKTNTIEPRPAVTGTVLREGGGSRPRVTMVDDGHGGLAVVKDFGASDRWFSTMLGVLLAHREARALEKLTGTAGIPGLLDRPTSRSIRIQAFDAEPVGQRADDVDWSAFCAALYQTIAVIHRRGVAHCDLRSPGNILVDRHGAPVLVDFVASYFGTTRSWNPVAAWLFAKACKADRSAVLKLKQKYCPELVTEAERSELGRESALERGLRQFGAGVRRLTRKLFVN